MKKDTLLSLSYRPPGQQIGRSESFGRGRLGSLLEKMYDPNADFTFFRSVVNPDAIDALPEYVVTLRDDTRWEVRRKRKGDEPDDYVGSRMKELRFDSSLRRDYMEVLQMLAYDRFGKANYGTYPLVDGMESMDAPREALSWPFVHIVKRDDFAFPRLFDQLNGDEAYALLRHAQAPHHYHTPHIDQLRTLGIPPLLVQPGEWKVTGRDLMQAIDFLVGFSYSNKLDSAPIDVD